MHVDQIKRLVKLVEESDIDVLEVRRWWTTVRITRRGAGNHVGESSETLQVVAAQPPVGPPAAPAPVFSAPAPAPAPAPADPARAAAATPDAGQSEIRSPMVGTFYRAPSPEAPNYVEVGGRVEKGQVVCIVEAMKLMNEIEAEISGTIERVLIENATPVEFNQPLFLVRPD